MIDVRADMNYVQQDSQGCATVPSSLEDIMMRERLVTALLEHPAGQVTASDITACAAKLFCYIKTGAHS